MLSVYETSGLGSRGLAARRCLQPGLDGGERRKKLSFADGP